MDKICCIFGASPAPTGKVEIPEGAYIIAADAGYNKIIELGLAPDLAVGDFDSLSFEPHGVEVVRHPAVKDDTDTALAVSEGLRRGYRDFYIYGALGGRLDHAVANLQTLAFIASQGARGFLIGEDMSVASVKDGCLRFSADFKGTVSVFALCGEAEGVYLDGLKYPLTCATLCGTIPLGVSNEFLGAASTVRVERGTLAVIWKSQGILPKYE